MFVTKALKEEGDNKPNTLKIGPFTQQSLLQYAHLLNTFLVLAGTAWKEVQEESIAQNLSSFLSRRCFIH